MKKWKSIVFCVAFIVIALFLTTGCGSPKNSNPEILIKNIFGESKKGNDNGVTEIRHNDETCMW